MLQYAARQAWWGAVLTGGVHRPEHVTRWTRQGFPNKRSQTLRAYFRSPFDG